MESNTTRGICGTEVRHPLRGLACVAAVVHGFADSPVALSRHPFGILIEGRFDRI